MMEQQVLIATLGGEPQVVTQVSDLLEVQAYQIRKVIVIHTVATSVREALQLLAGEFKSTGGCAYQAVPIVGQDGPVKDIATEADTGALLRTLYQTVLAEKRAGNRIHLSIAGGRKPMAVYGMVVAQLLFDASDRLWHLLSATWRSGDPRVMHAPPGHEGHLVTVPILRWSNISLAATELMLYEDPWEAIQAQRSMKKQEGWRRKREFVEGHLTRAERELFQLACQTGLGNAAIAEKLGKAEKTVANQFTRIYTKLSAHFRMIELNRSRIVPEFKGYFDAIE